MTKKVRKSSQKPKIKSEASTEDEIIEYLRRLQPRFFFWKQEVAGVQVEDRFFRTGLKGCADILGLYSIKAFPTNRLIEIEPSTIGVFVAIETKAKNGKLSPDQKLFRKQVEAKGGVYIIGRSVWDVSQGLTKAGLY